MWKRYPNFRETPPPSDKALRQQLGSQIKEDLVQGVEGGDDSEGEKTERKQNLESLADLGLC